MRIRTAALTLAALAAAACATSPAPPPAARVIALKNPGFEDPPIARPCPGGWDCTMHADPHSFRFFHDGNAASGKASLCIEPAGREPWGLASQGVFDIQGLYGARVRFSAAIRVEGVTGDGAGPYVMARVGRDLAHDKTLITGTQGWRRIAVEIEVPKGAPFIELGVSLEGRGRVCLDDALLEVIQEPKKPV